VVDLRPHHLLDIVTSIGHGHDFTPHPYGHNVHVVASKTLAGIDWKARFVIGADEICRPCSHLGKDGLCNDVLRQVQPHLSKQHYNDSLDARLMACLGMKQGAEMTVREFLELINRHVPGIENICTHPGEAKSERLDGLAKGLSRLLKRGTMQGEIIQDV